MFLRILPNGKLDTADIFVFCLGAGKYILTDWLTIWKVISKLTKDHGTVVYKDSWRLNKYKFVALLKKVISGKF